ncbi:choice-of-anchor D domain-containing protein [Halomicrobium sp. IBSBa]|nr:choice-of-anchor D domain-containing protein [Halomicrobium sp. IBSBa]
MSAASLNDHVSGSDVAQSSSAQFEQTAPTPSIRISSGQTPGSGGVPAKVDDNYVLNPDETIAVHGFAPAQLRPNDNTKSSAATSIQSAQVTATVTANDNEVDLDLDKEELNVYDEGTAIEYQYTPPTGVSEYKNDDYQLVAARIGPDASRPESVEDLPSLLTDNSNVEAEVVETYRDQETILDDEPVTYTPTESGRYVVGLVQIEDSGGSSDPTGFEETTAGNIDTDDEVTIIGADSLLVQEGESSINAPSSIAPGSTRNVAVDAGDDLRSIQDGKDVSHTVLLINEDRLSQQDVHATGNEDDMVTSIDSSIKEIKADSDLSSGAEPFGTSIGTSDTSDVIDVTTLLDNVVDSDNINTDGGETLYAAVGSTVGDAKDEVTITVPEGTPADTYTLVHVATIDGETRSSTSTIERQVGSPKIEVSPSDTIDFGEIKKGNDRTKEFTIKNTGTAELTVTDITTSGSYSESFTVGETFHKIGAGNSKTVHLTFDNARSFDNGQLTIETAHGTTKTIAIEATVTKRDDGRDPDDEDDDDDDPTDTPTDTPDTDTPDDTPDTDTPDDTPDTDTPDDTPDTDTPDDTPDTDTPDDTPDTDTPDDTPDDGDDGDDDDDDTTQGDGPGFTPVMVLVALVATLAILRRRA